MLGKGKKKWGTDSPFRASDLLPCVSPPPPEQQGHVPHLGSLSHETLHGWQGPLMVAPWWPMAILLSPANTTLLHTTMALLGLQGWAGALPGTSEMASNTPPTPVVLLISRAPMPRGFISYQALPSNRGETQRGLAGCRPHSPPGSSDPHNPTPSQLRGSHP